MGAPGRKLGGQSGRQDTQDRMRGLTLLHSTRTYIYEQKCLLTHLVQTTYHVLRHVPLDGLHGQVWLNLRKGALLTGHKSWGEETTRVCVSQGKGHVRPSSPVLGKVSTALSHTPRGVDTAPPSQVRRSLCSLSPPHSFSFCSHIRRELSPQPLREAVG